MRSSSAARLACASAIAAVVLSALPVQISADAIARTIPLPAPIITTPVTNVATSTPSLPKTAKAASSSASGSLSAAVTSSGFRLNIPSIGLNDPIVNVGVDSTGAMAVPNGKTNEVGWYDGGPMPGQVGSAVLDAHIFAAFTKLNQVSVGDDIYVQENGQTLHFVVTAVKEFALSQITSQDLFVPTSDRDLNLITCAGKLTPDHSTYDHRLVVYSTLVN
jgi:LPXTG-site transpeptidase (sortase) family protein